MKCAETTSVNSNEVDKIKTEPNHEYDQEVMNNQASAKITEIQQYQYDHLSMLPQFPTPGLFPSAPQDIILPQTSQNFTPVPEIQQSQDDHFQPPQTTTELETMDRQFECDFCQKLFKRESNWKFHIMSFHYFEIFPCNFCGWPFETEIGLKRHLGAFHQGLLSPGTSTEFTSVPEIQQYQDDHSQSQTMVLEKTMEQQFKCDFCSALFKKKSDLKFHIMLFHYFDIFHRGPEIDKKSNLGGRDLK